MRGYNPSVMVGLVAVIDAESACPTRDIGCNETARMAGIKPAIIGNVNFPLREKVHDAHSAAFLKSGNVQCASSFSRRNVTTFEA